MFTSELKIKPKQKDKATVSVRTGENSVVVIELKRSDLEIAIQEYRSLLEGEED